MDDGRGRNCEKHAALKTARSGTAGRVGPGLPRGKIAYSCTLLDGDRRQASQSLDRDAAATQIPPELTADVVPNCPAHRTAARSGDSTPGDELLARRQGGHRARCGEKPGSGVGWRIGTRYQTLAHLPSPSAEETCPPEIRHASPSRYMKNEIMPPKE